MFEIFAPRFTLLTGRNARNTDRDTQPETGETQRLHHTKRFDRIASATLRANKVGASNVKGSGTVFV